MQPHFREQLVDLWDGKLFQQREVVNYALDGTELHLHLQFSVLPGHERDWSLVQVALTDITARKKAEAYLEFLGKHDVLTKLYNRSFYVDEINRLERKGPSAGHHHHRRSQRAEGRQRQARPCRRRRAAAPRGRGVRQAVEKPASRRAHRRRRIRGPAARRPTRATAQAMIETIEQLIELNNSFLPRAVAEPLDGSRRSAAGRTARGGGASRADDAMYEAKRRFYALSDNDRRRVG